MNFNDSELGYLLDGINLLIIHEKESHRNVDEEVKLMNKLIKEMNLLSEYEIFRQNRVITGFKELDNPDMP